MNLTHYLELKKKRRLEEFQPRAVCTQCKKPTSTCYCAKIRPFASWPRFVILMHPEEIRKGIATGRMAHRIIQNSFLFEGEDFSDHRELGALLRDPAFYPVLLYPGPHAVCLSSMAGEARRNLLPPERQPLFIILDGTWSQAKRMKRRSSILAPIPQFQFTPPGLSQFLVRKQPRANYYSTIESIHHMIELFAQPERAEHQNLMDVFQSMVAQQLQYENRYGARLGYRSVRGQRQRVPVPAPV